MSKMMSSVMPAPMPMPMPKAAYSGGRGEDAVLRKDAELAAKLEVLDAMRREAQALAEAARCGVIEARSDVIEGDQQQVADLTLLKGLAEAYELYTGRRATFTPTSDTQRAPSECIRFIRAAYAEFELRKPGAAGLVKAWQRLGEKPRVRGELTRAELRKGLRRAARCFGHDAPK